jgi:hypothetical protein
MRDVIGVLLDGRSPYDRLAGTLSASSAPRPSSAPAGLIGPGQAASPTPVTFEPVVTTWSPTSSSGRRRKAVDWRQWLDVVDEVGLVPAGVADVTLAEELLVSQGIATRKQLRGRSDARAAFHALQAMTPAGITPAIVRRLMDDWRFADAEAGIERATEVAVQLLGSADAGTDPTSAPWQAFEAANRSQELEEVAALVE